MGWFLSFVSSGAVGYVGVNEYAPTFAVGSKSGQIGGETKKSYRTGNGK